MHSLHLITRLAAALFAFAALQAPATDFAHAPPAFRLGDAARPLAYEARLAIDPRQESFTGEVRIGLHIQSAAAIVWMNANELTIEDAYFEQDGKRIDVEVVKGGDNFAGFAWPNGTFRAGPAVATIRYRGRLDGNSPRGLFREREADDWYAFSQFESYDARRAFPCFDEPGWKTPWQLTIDAPKGDAVVSNTLPVKEMPAPGMSGWTRHVFAWTKPLPSYLVALAVGPFDVVDGGRAGHNKVPLRYITTRGRGAEARLAMQATPRILETLEDYFGIAYPYDKLDTVAVPRFDGAMENAAMITYDSPLVLAKSREESDQQRYDYTSVGAHEIAHQWFGDYVTMAWWDDTWLNEAFATWMAGKIVNRINPAWDDGYHHAEYRRRSLAADRLASARRVRNPVASYDDIDAAFDAITYDKGGEVLAMFESWITPARFQKGVRSYLKLHAWHSATSDDFFKALAEAAGRPEMMKAFTAFVQQPGYPLEDVALHCDAGAPSVAISQSRFKPKGSTAPDAQWVTPVCFRYPGTDGLATQCVEAGAAPVSAALTATNSCPAWLVGNARGEGQYMVRYGTVLAKRNAEAFRDVSPQEALALVGDATLLAESGTIPTGEALQWGEAALAHPSPLVRLTGVELAHAMRDAWLDEAASLRKQALVVERIVPYASEMGWKHRERDSQDVRIARTVVLPDAAEFVEGASLRDDARELALRWLTDRSAVDADMVRPVLDTAARFADEPTFLKLAAALPRIKDARDQKALARAIGHVREPRLRERAMRLAITEGDESISSITAIDLLWAGARDEHNRRAALDFVTAHYDEVQRKVPEDSLGRIVAAMEGLCTRSDRDAFVAAFEKRAPAISGAAIAYRESLESIDLCLAARGR